MYIVLCTHIVYMYIERYIHTRTRTHAHVHMYYICTYVHIPGTVVYKGSPLVRECVRAMGIQEVRYGLYLYTLSL